MVEQAIKSNLIAPCGMNCALCRANHKEKDPCPGCRNFPLTKKTRANCKLRICQERTGEYCFSCDKFPCERLSRLDKRYRERYGMSEIENLEMIRDKGIKAFLISEQKKWQNSDGIFCVHNKERYKVD